MARKEKQFHYLYKITNTKNSKYYIGMHSTNNMEDGYMGSGKRITNSVRKHGKDVHVKEILEYFDDRESLRQREIELVKEDLLNDPMCMNLQTGGGGGFIDDAHCKKCSIAGGRGFSEMVKNNPEFRTKLQNLGALAFKNAWAAGKFDNMVPPFKDKFHTNETKKLISEKNSLNRFGKKNSQFGTRWINKDTIDKKIQINEIESFIEDGWTLGRYKPLSCIKRIK